MGFRAQSLRVPTVDITLRREASGIGKALHRKEVFDSLPNWRLGISTAFHIKELLGKWKLQTRASWRVWLVNRQSVENRNQEGVLGILG